MVGVGELSDTPWLSAKPRSDLFQLVSQANRAPLDAQAAKTRHRSASNLALPRPLLLSSFTL